MDLAVVSLIALLVAIAVSCTARVNVGFLALVFAWVIGVYLAPDDGLTLDKKAKAVLAYFPGDLFITLLGTMFLFMLAQVNGTLGKLADRAVLLCRGNAGLVPIMFFLLTLLITTTGAGNIASVALIAPMAMAAATRARIPAFLMAIMVGHGSIAGAMSPFTPLGVVTAKNMETMGVSGHGWQFYLNNLLANALVGIGGYLLFGGWRLFEAGRATSLSEEPEVAEAAATSGFARRHWFTLAVLAALVYGVIFLRVNIGLGAVACAVVLVVTRQADEKEAMKALPWNVIVMVCGMTVLVGLIERTGGLELFTDLLARYSTARDVNGLLAFLTGLISVFSSTSGVVLPSFLPTVPGLIEKLGGGDPISIASSIIIGGNLVDVSPVSTIGALCLASAGDHEDRQKLFYKLLVWGVSMSAVGAAMCYVFLR